MTRNIKKFLQVILWQYPKRSNIIYRFLIHAFIIFLSLCCAYIFIDNISITFIKVCLIIYTYLNFLSYLPSLLIVGSLDEKSGNYLFIAFILFSYILAFVSLFILIYLIKKDLA
ncbi:Uncharacterised protein [Peptoniphilus harei]|uniref:Uncharacterized protein n=1 Tax=Peptoniphilus harei TaxID=54005 RepID=A0A2X1Y170_9FIRM|nr:Uncharacterised protein [Peptoniphilus harei]